MGYIRLTNIETGTIEHDSRVESLSEEAREYIRCLSDIEKKLIGRSGHSTILKIIDQAIQREWLQSQGELPK
jgi:hypothetical protein